MAHRIKHTHKDKTDSALSWAIIILSILGAMDALYLLVYKLTGNNQMCLGNGGCHNVNFSPYSEIYHTPVAFFGLMGYVCIGTIMLLEPHWKLTREQGPIVVFGAALVGVLFSAYLTYLEFYAIHAVCPFCVASAIIITLIFILAIIRLVKQTAN
jgi:uncharacterized membrane protein